jgi:hypothetical protein
MPFRSACHHFLRLNGLQTAEYEDGQSLTQGEILRRELRNQNTKGSASAGSTYLIIGR